MPALTNSFLSLDEKYLSWVKYAHRVVIQVVIGFMNAVQTFRISLKTILTKFTKPIPITTMFQYSRKNSMTLDILCICIIRYLYIHKYIPKNTAASGFS